MTDTPDPTNLPETPEAEKVEPSETVDSGVPETPAATPIAPITPSEDAVDDEPAVTEMATEGDDEPIPGPPSVTFGEDAPTSGDEPPKKKGFSPAILGGLGCGCILLLIAGVVGIFSFIKWKEAEDEKKAQIAEAQLQLAKAWQNLQFYKTNKSANADQPNLVLEANSLARSSNKLHPSDEAMALMALTQVWGNRWHLMPPDDYNSSLWTQDEAFTKTTLASSGEPAAYLARALILGYGCHLQGNPNPSNSTCSQAESAFTKAKTNMGGAPGWLRFELVWIEADFWNKMAWYAYGKRKRDTAKRYWSRVRDICSSPIESLASAPVNDEELMESCVYATGALGDYDSWLTWSRMMRADDIKDHRRTRSGTLKIVFRSAMPKCRSPRLKLRRVGGHKNFPRIDPYKNDTHPFCAKAGLIAMGCPYQAMQFDNWRYQSPQYSYAWAQLDRAASNNPYSGTCYLNK